MYRLIVFLVIILLPVSTWAWKPLKDVDLSNATSPPSLVIRTSQKSDVQSHAGGTENEEKSEIYKSKNRFSFLSIFSLVEDEVIDAHGYRVNKTMIKDSRSEGDLDRDAVYDSRHGTARSIMHSGGQTERSDKPVIVDLIPDGSDQLRIYYTNHTSYTVLPKSWVDIIPR